VRLVSFLSLLDFGSNLKILFIAVFGPAPRSSPSSPVSAITPTFPIPHPNSAHNSALTQTTFSRLRRLNLKNYAAPVPVPCSATTAVTLSLTSSIVNADLIAEAKEKKEDSFPQLHVEGWEYEMVDMGATMSTSPPEIPKESAVKSASAIVMEAMENGSVMKKYKGVAPSSLPVQNTSEKNDEVPENATIFEQSAEDVEATTGSRFTTTSAPTTPTFTLRLPQRYSYAERSSLLLASPSTSRPVSPLEVSSSMFPFTSPRRSPRTSPRGFPRSPVESISEEFEFAVNVHEQPRPTSPSAVDALAQGHEQQKPACPPLHADSVYQTFVREWCFAGAGPSPSPSAFPGVGVGSGLGHSATPKLRLGASPSPSPSPM
jgi:hypothetical protein